MRDMRSTIDSMNTHFVDLPAAPPLSTNTAAVHNLRKAIRHYNAVTDLVTAGRQLIGPSATEGPMIEAARLNVVAKLDACAALGLANTELDTICADEAAQAKIAPIVGLGA